MELTKQQFNILSAVAEGIGMPDADDEILKEMTELGWIKSGAVTEKGLAALEPYRVRRAIFMAAGFGTRLKPATLDTPKPMVRVNGKRMIETSLDACLAAGIEEIYIIRGYLADKFDELLTKYPMIKFIENPEYATANSISSAYYARHLLENAYICEADLVVTEPTVFRKYQYTSGIMGYYCEKTDDWCLVSDKDGIVQSLQIGGEHCHQEIGIYNLTASDGRKAAHHVEELFTSPDGKNHYWGQVIFSVYKDQYQIALRECKPGDIVEIDTFDELKKIDPSYNTVSDC